MLGSSNGEIYSPAGYHFSDEGFDALRSRFEAPELGRRA
jgi:hypothetical protein